MSSAVQTGPDAMVTLKVTFEGTTRRAKMPLREMVPLMLEKSVRTFLHIPVDAKAIIERYSDSAAAYVLLDSNNMSVYKQLYRAAKAKSKLKLRVTVLHQPKEASKSATVEDEPEAASLAPTENTLRNDTESIMDQEQISSKPSPSHSPTNLPIRTSQFMRSYDSNLLTNAASFVNAHETNRREFQDRLSRLVKTDSQGSQAAEPFARLLHAPTSAVTSTPSTIMCPITGAGFAVCCNSCEKTVPEAHYHCSTCEDGDFDLCPSCVDQGITCHSTHHWLIKRTLVKGQIVTSTTETIQPKAKVGNAVEVTKPRAEQPNPRTISSSETPVAARVPFDPLGTQWSCLGDMRTCNSCVQELPVREFLHCDTCEDFDLCQKCFSKDGHGHHPKHGFASAVAGVTVPEHIKVKLRPGRNQRHQAICDGCDKYITGVRHKCLDCPDWDYCGNCIVNASFVHPSHRFAPIYESLMEINSTASTHSVHMGICCDGPLCAVTQSYPSYIRGIRYKCAVCHDLDFCANCEASPANEHNKTHPLIKFKTPVRHVSVTTTGEHQDGKRMPAMGDRNSISSPKAAEPASPKPTNAMNAVQTVVDVKPVESVKNVKEEAPKPAVAVAVAKSPASTRDRENDLRAVFLSDSVADGTIMPPNHVFEQTWVLRNEGHEAWPAGCSVKFVGGDYMGHVDSAHPAGISELVSASESTVCYAPLAPGQEFSFTVLLRTPARAGKIASYWRLATPNGHKFGHRLWCEVNVRAAAASLEPKKDESSASSSTMIFPKLEKESPDASVHEENRSVAPTAGQASDAEGFENCEEEDEWDASEDGFMTDEEYDILDASDEEFLEEQEKKLMQKK